MIGTALLVAAHRDVLVVAVLAVVVTVVAAFAFAVVLSRSIFVIHAQWLLHHS
jgi:hypothetical protein